MRDDDEALRERLLEAESIISCFYYGNDTADATHAKAKRFIEKRLRGPKPTRLSSVILSLTVSKRTAFAIQAAAQEDGVDVCSLALHFLQRGLENRKQQILRRKRDWIAEEEYQARRQRKAAA